MPRVSAILIPIPIPEDLSDEEATALAHLVEEVVVGHGMQNGDPSLTVVGRHGELIPIDEDEIDVWLSPGSFG